MGTYYDMITKMVNDAKNTVITGIKFPEIELPSYIKATTLPFDSIAIDKTNVYGDSKMTKENKEKKEKEYVSLDVRRIIKNGPATIVFWEDNTKTVVVRKKGEKDNMYYAFCAALAKRIYGNNSQVNKIVKSIVDETKKTSKKEKK